MYLDVDGINKLIKEYERDSKALKDELYRFSWFMRGGLSFSEAFMLSPEDREILNKIVESNLETTKTIQMPFF